MLVSAKMSPSEQALRSALALANAQVHSFFGNDVMLEEWAGLWLREGLAAYLESWAVDQVSGRPATLTTALTSATRSGA